MAEQAIFMTGGGGFLGRYILDHLLRDTAATVYLLENGKFIERLRQFIEGLDVDADAKARAKIVEGDIGLPGLGLPADVAGEIQERVTHAAHLAALYNLAAPRQESVRANVDGTRNVLDFLARAKNLARFAHTSTLAVAGTYTGLFTEDDFDKGQSFKNYYEETKFLSERLVRERWGEIPSVVIRPTVVVGHSKTGHIEKIDGPYYALTMIARNLHLIAPDSGPTKCHIVPVDYIADGYFALLMGAGRDSAAYLLGDSSPLTYNEFIDLACEHWPKTKPLMRVSPAWMAPFARLSVFQKLSGVPYQAFMYTANPVEYTFTNAESVLHPMGLRCPSVREYIDPMIAYFRQHYHDPKVRRGDWKQTTT